MRVFRTKWFTRAAKSHGIKDIALCEAFKTVLEGKVDNLSGGVYKKRLNQHRDRSIILAKGGQNWFYTFLFAKQYAALHDAKLTDLIRMNEIVEICHDCKK